MVSYRHGVDIDSKNPIDAEAVDDQIERLVHSLALAYETAGDVDASFRQLVAYQLRLFLSTHRSIWLLMKQRSTELAALSDAMSLAREQIEKIYIVAILLENPRYGTMRYLKDDWRRGYERYLLNKDERGALPRFREFLSGYAPEHTEKERLQLGVTEGERDHVEFVYRNPGTTVPSHLRASSEIMARFPTPAGVIKKVSDATLSDGLRRWYHEYGYFSGYSHAGSPKLMVRYFEASKNYTSSQKKGAIEKGYYQAVWVSYLAVASAGAEAALRTLPRAGGGHTAIASPDLYVQLDALWAVMRRAALLGKALWELRVKYIMPSSVGTIGGGI